MSESYRLTSQNLLADDFGFILEREQAFEFAMSILRGYFDANDTAIQDYNEKRRNEYSPIDDSTDEEPEGAKERGPSEGYLYLMWSNGLHKIGISKDPRRRRKEIEMASGYPVDLIDYVWVVAPAEKEHALHHHFADERRMGEWFALNQAQVGYALEAMRQWFKGNEE